MLLHLFHPVGYPSIRMTVTHRMNPDTFAAILDLSTAYGKKAKKKKKKVFTLLHDKVLSFLTTLCSTGKEVV